MSITRRDLAAGATLALAPALLARAAFAQDQSSDDRSNADPGEDRSEDLPRDVVYIQSNNATVGQNSILGYRRAANGSLTPLPGSPFLTGGRGFFIPNFTPGPFDSDGEITLDRRRGIIYAVNSGSSSVAAMRIGRDGALSPVAYSPFPIPGTNPISVAVRRNSVIVLNADGDPAQHVNGGHPTAIVATIDGRTGGLSALPYTAVNLPDGSQPTQVTTVNTGRFIFTTEFFGRTIRSFVEEPGRPLRQLDRQTPPQQAGAATPPLPLGIWAHDKEPILYVGFVNTAQLGVYSYDDDGRLTFLRTATNSGQAICWLRTAFGGARLYSMNTADQSISVYDTTRPAHPKEIQNLGIGGLGGLVQFDVTSDQRFLYIVEQANNPAAVAQGNRIRVAALNRRDGSVSDVPGATLVIDVPVGTVPQGAIAL